MNDSKWVRRENKESWFDRTLHSRWLAWVWLPLSIMAALYGKIIIDTLEFDAPLPLPFLLMVVSLLAGAVFGGLKMAIAAALANGVLLIAIVTSGAQRPLLTDQTAASIALTGAMLVVGVVLGQGSDRNRKLLANLEILRDMEDQFVSNVSHELRSPITILKLHHQLLRSDTVDLSKLLPVMERQTMRLERTLENMLRLSILQRGHTALALANVDLNKLVDECVADRVLLAEQHSVNLEVGLKTSLPKLLVDGGLLSDALGLLLNNAIIYAAPGGCVTVATLTRNHAQHSWAGFSVSDNGPGISSVEQPFVFERFYRGRVGRDSDAPGTGLGLAIAREIVERHRGFIELQSSGKTGDGATFTVWLPAAGSTLAHPPESPRADC